MPLGEEGGRRVLAPPTKEGAAGGVGVLRTKATTMDGGGGRDNNPGVAEGRTDADKHMGVGGMRKTWTCIYTEYDSDSQPHALASSSAPPFPPLPPASRMRMRIALSHRMRIDPSPLLVCARRLSCLAFLLGGGGWEWRKAEERGAILRVSQSSLTKRSLRRPRSALMRICA